MGNSGIYCIVNAASNKFYVGSSANLKKRRSTHFCHLRLGYHENQHLQRAWNKYGSEAFSFLIIANDIEKENLIENEQFWLDIIKPQYNMRKIATSNLGMKCAPLSEETRRKMSQARLGKPHSEETRRKMSLSKMGNVPSESTRQKLRKASTGRFHTEESKRKIALSKTGANNVNFGVPLTEDFKHRLRTIIRKTNTSGYAGVSFSKASGKWVAVLRINGGRKKHLGLFPSPELANEARQKYIQENNL